MGFQDGGTMPVRLIQREQSDSVKVVWIVLVSIPGRSFHGFRWLCSYRTLPCQRTLVKFSDSSSKYRYLSLF